MAIAQRVYSSRLTIGSGTSDADSRADCLAKPAPEATCVSAADNRGTTMEASSSLQCPSAHKHSAATDS